MSTRQSYLQIVGINSDRIKHRDLDKVVPWSKTVDTLKHFPILKSIIHNMQIKYTPFSSEVRGETMF